MRKGSVLVVVAMLVALLPSPAIGAAADRRDDYNRDGVSDLLAINRQPGQPDDGCLYRWFGNGDGGLGAAQRIGGGGSAYLPAAGRHMNSGGDGALTALTPAGSRPTCLWRWWGDGQGGFGAGAQVGCGWELYTELTGPGDITGDGNADLVALDLSKTDPCLWRWPGNGQGGFAPAAVINCGGWHLYRDITAAGDVNRDGKPDLVGIKRDTGCLYHWFGDGRGGFGTGTASSCGWAGFEDLTGLSDLNEDGNGDLVGRLPFGAGKYALFAWYSTGFGGYSRGNELGQSGWASMDLI
ncbi:VCBS repeat-containing protein [Micromonospora sp. CPCC 205371]|nr:VCBS repeat-containing protein [Micromonospora sp. CPCC 205371]